jgi:BirA family transcriptional regulator, biotin operon repressor / biotin---[acetyl-CoA-carboxylase] ligase
MKIGHKIIHKKELFESSMDLARRELYGVDDGTIFTADKYHSARGRQGREWKIFPGQLTLTFVLKPKNSSDSLNYLNMAIAIAATKSLSNYGIGIKWPNDFVADNGVASKKVGGMLIEVIWKNNVMQGVVVGISINCNNSLKNDPLANIATSLFDITGTTIESELLQLKLIETLNEWYEIWLSCNFDLIFSAWKALQVCLGKTISVHMKNGDVIKGTMLSVDPDGNAVLIDSENRNVPVSFHSVENVIVF